MSNRTGRTNGEAGTLLEVPIDLVWVNDHPLVVFGLCSRNALGFPFWDDVARSRRKVTRMEPLDAIDLDTGNHGLIGGVFHTTRCGSTLVMRQFSALPGVFGLSEPSMILKLLEGPRTDSGSDRTRLRKLVALFSQALAPLASRIVIKWPNLGGLHAAFLASALPEVPNIFLHRDAGAILQSIARNPLGGMENIRPGHLFSPPMIVAGASIPDDHLARAALSIARVCKLVQRDPDVVAVDYDDLPDVAWLHLAAFFGLSLTPADVELMRAAAIPHSKAIRSTEPFREMNTLQAPSARRGPMPTGQDILQAAIDDARNNMPRFTREPMR